MREEGGEEGGGEGGEGVGEGGEEEEEFIISHKLQLLWLRTD